MYKHPKFTKTVTLTLTGEFVSKERFDEACEKSLSAMQHLQPYRITKSVSKTKPLQNNPSISRVHVVAEPPVVEVIKTHLHVLAVADDCESAKVDSQRIADENLDS